MRATLLALGIATATLLGCSSGSKPSGATAPSNSLNTFDADVARIKRIVPGWDNGTGLSALFVKASTDMRLSLIYVDPTPPEWKAPTRTWIIQSTARINKEPRSTILLALPRLEAGTFEGAESKEDCIIGAAFTKGNWDPRHPETAWSINKGGWCRVQLSEAGLPGDLEGAFEGKLVTNAGDSFVLISKGYVYINR